MKPRTGRDGRPILTLAEALERALNPGAFAKVRGGDPKTFDGSSGTPRVPTKAINGSDGSFRARARDHDQA